MRGTKLSAWEFPPVWKHLRENTLTVPEKSKTPEKQIRLLKATENVLTEIAKDIREGLLETVGVDSRLSTDGERCSMILDLPEGADTEKIAKAIGMENIEAWLGEKGEVHLAVNPWFSSKDVDQAVLSAVKVIHVMLGIHATDNLPPKTFVQKMLASVAEIMESQKNI